jgi:hypothetical protein
MWRGDSYNEITCCLSSEEEREKMAICGYQQWAGHIKLKA